MLFATLDPLQAAYTEQLMPQSTFGSPLGSLLGGTRWWRPSPTVPVPPHLGRLLPFSIDPLSGANGVAGEVAPLGILMPQTALDPETQALNDLMESAASGAIKRVYEYLKNNRAQYSQLAECDPMVQRAAEMFEQRDFARAFVQAYQAYRAIHTLRSRTPTLPPL